MKASILTFEELKRAKETYNEISYQGFLINVANSFKEGKITKEEKDELLSTNQSLSQTTGE